AIAGRARRAARRSARRRTRVNIHNRAEQLDRLGARTLERVAPDDRAVAPSGLDRAHFVEQLFVADFRTARENHDSPAVETTLHDVGHARGLRIERYAVGLVGLFGFGLLKMRARQLDLDDVGAELCRDLRRIGDHVERGLALLADARAARVRPYDYREAVR